MRPADRSLQQGHLKSLKRRGPLQRSQLHRAGLNYRAEAKQGGESGNRQVIIFDKNIHLLKGMKNQMSANRIL